MDTKTIIETAEEKLIHTYNRYQIVLDKGDGVRLLILVPELRYLHWDIIIKNTMMQ